jgi:hypothetical protein
MRALPPFATALEDEHAEADVRDEAMTRQRSWRVVIK